MISPEAIEQILAQYTKHGWKLRRVLLSPALAESLSETGGLFEGTEVRESMLDGLWFSRSSRPGLTAWELRHLSPVPYALVGNIQDGTDGEEAEQMLKDLETKMIDAAASRRPGH